MGVPIYGDCAYSKGWRCCNDGEVTVTKTTHTYICNVAGTDCGAEVPGSPVYTQVTIYQRKSYDCANYSSCP